MNRKDKAIIIFYILLAGSYVSYAVWADKTFGNVKLTTEQSKQLGEITFVKTVNVSKTKLFETFFDVGNYPMVLPENVISVNILNRSNNVIYSEDELAEKFVKTTLVVKNTVVPYESQTMEVTGGDAQGTTILLTFKGNDTFTTIKTDVKLHLNGVLTPFAFFPEPLIQDQIDQKITEIANYAKGFDSKYERIVDDLYRKILYRPADPIGLQYFSSQLASGRMTISDIQSALSDSAEAKHALAPSEIKTMDELNATTKITINNLYQEILHRNADTEGLQYFGSELESGKMTPYDVRIALLSSDEAKHALAPSEIKTMDELNATTKITINNLYQEILHRNADTEGLQYFGSELESGKMTTSDISQALFNSPEGQNVELTYHPSSRFISDLYMQIFHRQIDNQTLGHYVSLLESKNMTFDQIKKELLAKNQSIANP